MAVAPLREPSPDRVQVTPAPLVSVATVAVSLMVAPSSTSTVPVLVLIAMPAPVPTEPDSPESELPLLQAPTRPHAARIQAKPIARRGGAETMPINPILLQRSVTGSLPGPSWRGDGAA